MKWNQGQDEGSNTEKRKRNGEKRTWLKGNRDMVKGGIDVKGT